MESTYVSMLLNLILVLSLILLGTYLLRKFRFNRLTQNNPIQILNSVSIGSKEKIILLSVNNRCLLVGATHQSIQTLYIFDPDQQQSDMINTLQEEKTFSETMTQLSNVTKNNLN
jgi:flagellar protein FliO/FliZ